MESLQYRIFSPIMKILPLILKVKILYFIKIRAFLDLKNCHTFNEKLQLRKVQDRNPLLTIAADKLASKKLVNELTENLYIPKIYWKGKTENSIKDLNYIDLPDNYVFKANHTSQTIRIIRKGNHLSKMKMIKFARKWLTRDQFGSLGEWAYKDIPRCVFIEEFLDFNDTVPIDYKYFVYHGKVQYIQVDSDRFIDHKRNMFDSEWNELDLDYTFKRKSPHPAKPKCLKQMIKISEDIGTKFDFVRVDLYENNKKIIFGELTIYPGAGFEKFPNREWDYLFGKHWSQKYEKLSYA